MGLESRKRAQARVDRIVSFKAELAELEREQALVLSAEQRTGLEAHIERLLATLSREFGVDATESARRISWGMRVAALLGTAALVAALILFLQRVWGYLPTAAHVTILTGIPLLLLAGAQAAGRRGNDPFYPALLCLAAGVAFVTELNVLGSILNVAPSPLALLAWSLVALLMAYAYGLRLILAAGLVLLCATAATLATTALGEDWANLMPHRAGFLIPPALVLYLIPEARRAKDQHDFDFIYRTAGAGTGLAALLLFSFEGHLCCHGLAPRAAAALCEILGLLLSAAVVYHGLRLVQTGLVNLGAIGFVVFLYVRLHAWWWEAMPKYLFFLLLGLIALGLVAMFRRLRARLAREASR